MRYGFVFLVTLLFAACSTDSEPQPGESKLAIPSPPPEPPPPEPPVQEENLAEDEDAGLPKDKGGQAGLFSSGKPMLIDFKRDHCLPCRLMTPWIASLQKKYEKKAAVVRIDLDRKENASLAKYFKVITVPTQIYLSSQGQIVMRNAGIATEKEMQKNLDRLLGGTGGGKVSY